MTDDKNEDNDYQPWSEYVDQEKIAELAREFIFAVMDCGMALNELKVNWEGSKFKARTKGQPISEGYRDAE